MSKKKEEKSWKMSKVTIAIIVFFLVAFVVLEAFEHKPISSLSSSHVPKLNIQDSNLVTLTAQPMSPYIRYKAKKTSKSNVLFTVKSAMETMEELKKAEKIPQELLVILDTSGSMGGSKIKNSKEVIKMMIQRLRPIDYIHFITFDSHAKVHFENIKVTSQTAKNELKDYIEKNVFSNGWTNMWDGLEKAEGILTSKEVKSRETSMKRIFLFSDGEVNSGKITDANGLKKKISKFHSVYNTYTSGFGVGEDFNEMLMRGLSSSGSGNYFYVQDGESISKVVGIAFEALMKVIGTDAKLRVKVDEMFVKKGEGKIRVGKGFASVKKVFGFEGNDENDVIVGDIRSNDERKILVDMEFDFEKLDLSLVNDDTVLLIPYEFVYVNKEKKEVVISGEFELKVTEEEGVVEETIVKKVSTFKRIQELNERDEIVTKFMDDDNFKDAINLKDELIQDFEDFDVSLKSDDYEDEDEYLEIKKEVEVIKRRLKKAAKVIKTESKETARKTQRFGNLKNAARSVMYDEL